MFCFVVVVMCEVVCGFGAWGERASSLNGPSFPLGLLSENATLQQAPSRKPNICFHLEEARF